MMGIFYVAYKLKTNFFEKISKKVCVVKIGAQTEKNNRNSIFVLHISLKLTFSTDDKHFLCCI